MAFPSALLIPNTPVFKSCLSFASSMICFRLSSPIFSLTAFIHSGESCKLFPAPSANFVLPISMVCFIANCLLSLLSSF